MKHTKGVIVKKLSSTIEVEYTGELNFNELENYLIFNEELPFQLLAEKTMNDYLNVFKMKQTSGNFSSTYER